MSANHFGFGDSQKEGQVSSKLNYMLQSLEIVMFVRTKTTHLLRGLSPKHGQ